MVRLRRGRVTRARPRRSKGKRRSTTRRRITRRPVMSRKRILNLTTRKKRDTMIQWNGTDTTATSILATATPCVMPWIPTARNLDPSSLVFNEAARSSTSTFMRGLQENMVIATNDGTPWEIRVVAFTYKGDRLLADTGTSYYTKIALNAMVRQALPYTLGTVPTLRSVLFRGATAIDWNDPIIAPLDTENLKICMDKRFSVKSGNNSGTYVRKKMWHPMNRTLKYNDDEDGESTDPSFLSTLGRPGMGDYYVCVIVSPQGNPLPSSAIKFEFNSTLYWHEK